MNERQKRVPTTNPFWTDMSETGIALLRLARAIEGGVTFNPNLTDAFPMFAVLEDDPRYQAIVQRMIDHMNSERAKLGLGPVARQPALGLHGI